MALIVVGIIWTSIIFDEAKKEYGSVLLEQSSSFEIKSEFYGANVGYYKLYMPEFSGEEIFVQILDMNKNVIQEGMVQTKMSVGYFDFDKDGKYTMKITNIAKNSINTQVEFGNTNSEKMLLSGIMILIGAVMVMITSYMKIKNYNIEHPEENIL